MAEVLTGTSLVGKVTSVNQINKLITCFRKDYSINSPFKSVHSNFNQNPVMMGPFVFVCQLLSTDLSNAY